MSKIEVNTVDVQCGSTLTLGSSGKTVQLATGASQSGFGRSGSVDWQTSSIKNCYFYCNIRRRLFCVILQEVRITVNLPAGSAGAIVSSNQITQELLQTNNLTISHQTVQIKLVE